MEEPRHYTPALGHPIPPLSYASRAGDLLFVSGLPGFRPDGGIDAEDFADQFARSVAMLRQVLALAGAEMRHLAKVNVLLTRASDVAEMNRLYAEAFGPPPHPARTTAIVQALPDPRMRIEIEAVALVAGLPVA